MMPSGHRFVGELHVPGSLARTRHRGAFTIPTRCRDTRERAGSSSPWPPVGLRRPSRSQRPHVARPAKNPDRSMWRALMSSSFRFVCVGPRSTPARGLPHNSSSSHRHPLSEGWGLPRPEARCWQPGRAGESSILSLVTFSMDVLAVSIFGKTLPRSGAEHGRFPQALSLERARPQRSSPG